MAKEREPDSKAVAEARVELRIVAEELQGVKQRLAAIVGHLMAASHTAEILGTNPYTGEVLTAEKWAAGCLSDFLKDVDALAERAQSETECDWRAEVEEELAEMTAAKAAGKP